MKHWAGPLAEFVLGTATEETAREKAVFEIRECVHTRRMQNLGNSISTNCSRNLQLGNMDVGVLEKEFQNLLSVKGSEYLDGGNFFYFLRTEEFYIARHWSLHHV